MDLYLDAHWNKELLRLPFDLHSRQHPGSGVLTWDLFPFRAQQLHGLHWLPLGTLTALLVVVAHRFAWLIDQLEHGQIVTKMPAVISHDCDNPICQNPAHLRVGTATSNRREWAARRTVPGSSLRDLRGARARGRAIALRDAAKTRANLATVIDDGLGDIDHFQDRLW